MDGWTLIPSWYTGVTSKRRIRASQRMPDPGWSWAGKEGGTLPLSCSSHPWEGLGPWCVWKGQTGRRSPLQLAGRIGLPAAWRAGWLLFM